MLAWLIEEAGKIGDVLALMGVISAGGLWVVKMLMTGRKQVAGLFEAQETFAKTQESLVKVVKEISDQLKPNGGHSMFDMISQAHTASQSNAKTLEDMKAAVDNIRAYQWSFAETVAAKPVWEANEKGECVRVNNEYAKLTERNTHELTGNGWENCVAPLDRARVFAEWTDAVERKRIFESTFNVRSKSGKLYTVRATAMPIFTASEKLIAFVGRYDEVTPLN